MKKLNQKYIFALLILLHLANAQDAKWGWVMHRYINAEAVDHLPANMSFFKDQQDYLSTHSVDPDQDDFPGYYHYIDIDNYPEFFQGTLPHDWDAMVSKYGESVVIDNGTVPWVIDEWINMLSALMSSGDWDNAWQVAAELGHYVADSHQALHLTRNYNGQYTGNYGIHSRYETQLFYSYLDSVPDFKATGVYWENVLDSVFQYIDDIYPYVDSIMIADDLATSQDPEYHSEYYDIMWSELKTVSIDAIHKSIINLASIWVTAWGNAGRPLPPGYHRTLVHVPVDYSTIQLAINAALDGDTILVAPGRYIENIDFKGKDIVVASNYILENDTSFIGSTIIQSVEYASVVTFRSLETSQALLCGFTIIARAASRDGEGVYVRYASPTLSHLHITTAEDTLLNKPALYGGSGGGIYLENSNSSINNVILESNEAMTGGGLYAVCANLKLDRVEVRNNSINGGGIAFLALGAGMAFDYSSALISNCVITDNVANGMEIQGFGIYSNHSELDLINVTVANNRYSEYTSLTDVGFGGGIYAYNSSHIKVVNGILWQNASDTEIYIAGSNDSGSVAVAFSDIEGGLENGVFSESAVVNWLTGNLSHDPLFTDVSTGDYHLLQNSPCIDAGLQDTMIFYNEGSDTLYIPILSYYGSAPDMGAFEYAYQTDITINHIDLPEFHLAQNYPNPFNPETTIEYEVPRAVFIKLELFNMVGQKIVTLVNEWQEPGRYSIDWDASPYSSGVYFYRLLANDFSLVKRCIFIK